MSSSVVITTPKDTMASAITTTPGASIVAPTVTTYSNSNSNGAANQNSASASPPMIRRLPSTGIGRPVIVQLKIESQTPKQLSGDASGSTVPKSATAAANNSISSSSSSGITVERRNNCCVISIPRSAVKTVPSGEASNVSTIRVAAAKRLSDSAGIGNQVRALVAAQEGLSEVANDADSVGLDEPLSAHIALQSALVLLPEGTRKRFQCRLCGNCYAKVEYLSRHVRQAHLRDSRLLALAKHSTDDETVTPDDEDNADENLSSSPTGNQGRKRQAVASTVGARCTLCDKQFSDYEELKLHLLSHPGSYECPRCGRWFPSLAGLQKHSSEEHASLEDHYGENDDDDDDEGVDDDENYNEDAVEMVANPAGTRMSVAGGSSSFSRPCICALCQAAFSESHLLANHVKSVHRLRKTGGRGDKRCYQCAYCAKCFHQHTNLRRHLTCHTGQRQFPCPICQKRFADRGDVNKHMVTHTGVRPFKCQVCGRRFGQRTNLRTHALTHAKPQQQLSAGLSPSAVIAAHNSAFKRRLIAANNASSIVISSPGRKQQHQRRSQFSMEPLTQDRFAYLDTIEVPEADEEVILG